MFFLKLIYFPQVPRPPHQARLREGGPARRHHHHAAAQRRGEPVRLPRQAPAGRGVHCDVTTPLGVPLFDHSVREQHEGRQGERLLRVQAQAEGEAGPVQVRQGDGGAPVLQVHDGAEAQAAEEEQEGGAAAEGADARAAPEAVAHQVRELVGGRREQLGGGERLLVLGGFEGGREQGFEADVEGVFQEEVEKVVEEGVGGFV